MKNYNIYILKAFKALLLLVLVAACSQDDVEQSIPLPAGQYPLDLTVSVEGMKSRSDGKDNWKGGDEIGVKIGSDSEVGLYTLDNRGNVDIANSANILHWKTTSPATVKAWYPAEPQTNVSIADQSGLSDFSSIDYLTATAENQSYKNSVDLTFKHQMAKVKCVLEREGDGITYNEATKATITFQGFTEASFAEGELTGSNFGDITAIKREFTYEALLVPADMTGKELFRVNINVGGYDKTFSYPPDGSHIELKPGTSYVFNVTLTRDDMVVSEISARWDGDEEEIITDPIPLNLYLPEEFFNLLNTGELEISQNATPSIDSDREDIIPEDDKYLVNGNTFTIIMPVTEDNLMKGFSFSEGIGSINRVRFEDRHVFTYKASTETVRLEYGEYMQVGDYLYTNGKWRPDIVGVDYNPGDDEEDGDINTGDLNRNPNFGYGYDNDGEIWDCIGVIFKVGPGNGDSPENYNMLETIHGYAVALHDASVPTEIGNWGANLKEEREIGEYPRFTDVYNGYTNTQKMLPIANNNKSAIDRNGELAYWAFYKLDEYNKSVKVPEYFSTWYIPSIGQLRDLYDFTRRRECLVMAGGEDFILSDVGIFPYEDSRFDTFGSKYWSSTQSPNETTWVFRFEGGKAATSAKRVVTITRSRGSQSRVRAVLTF